MGWIGLVPDLSGTACTIVLLGHSVRPINKQSYEFRLMDVVDGLMVHKIVVRLTLEISLTN